MAKKTSSEAGPPAALRFTRVNAIPGAAGLLPLAIIL
jgi:hypothetical protein